LRALEVMRAIAALRDLPGPAKGVLWVIAIRADNVTGECWPSLDTVAADAGISRSCAKARIRELVAAGYLSKRKRVREGSLEADSNLYTLQVGRLAPHLGHDAPDVGRHVTDPGVRGDRPVGHDAPDSRAPRDLELPNELPTGTPHGTSSLVLTHEEPAKVVKGRRERKHTDEEIAAKQAVIDAFAEAFALVKGLPPKLTHAGDHAAAFVLAKTYGEEARAIVRRALEDPFCLDKNANLRFIASRADSYRGARAPTGRVDVQPGAGPGQRRGWMTSDHISDAGSSTWEVARGQRVRVFRDASGQVVRREAEDGSEIHLPPVGETNEATT
jgi:hypothetical protein